MRSAGCHDRPGPHVAILHHSASRARRRLVLAAGAGLAVVYVVVALATGWLAGGPARPLFDGFAPPPNYNWVNPPPGADRRGPKPTAATADAPLSAGGSAPAPAATSDGQATATVEAGAVGARPPESGVRLQVTPLDPATLGPLPAGLRPESNAYQVTVTVLPSGAAVDALARPGTIALTAAAPASALLYSRDGTSWTETAARPFGTDHGLFAELNGPGYYLAVSRKAPRQAPALSATARVLLAVAVAVVASVAVAFAGPIRRAVRRRRG